VPRAALTIVSSQLAHRHVQYGLTARAGLSPRVSTRSPVRPPVRGAQNTKLCAATTAEGPRSKGDHIGGYGIVVWYLASIT
jgi:hypothetical protein